ncbi:MAG: ParA family protein [Gammaproteobacteria bacterium]|nr:ParA family protein [Gammaproteobacteria bacterium]
MKRFTVINMKGGCGKTTIATNLASAYANRGRNVTLIDYDPQGSSMYWMNTRPDDASKINGIAAYPSNKPVTRSWQLQLPQDTDRVIVDTPAGLSGLDLVDQVRGTHTIIIPVLSSYLDTHVTADFIRDLYLTAKVRPEHTRLCIICNRVKNNTIAFRALKRFLDSLDIPLIGQLRETQNYVKASDSGLGVQELKPAASDRDIDDWNKIISWLDSDVRHKDLKAGLRAV